MATVVTTGGNRDSGDKRMLHMVLAAVGGSMLLIQGLLSLTAALAHMPALWQWTGQPDIWAYGLFISQWVLAHVNAATGGAHDIHANPALFIFCHFFVPVAAAACTISQIFCRARPLSITVNIIGGLMITGIVINTMLQMACGSFLDVATQQAGMIAGGGVWVHHFLAHVTAATICQCLISLTAIILSMVGVCGLYEDKSSNVIIVNGGVQPMYGGTSVMRV